MRFLDLGKITMTILLLHTQALPSLQKTGAEFITSTRRTAEQFQQTPGDVKDNTLNFHTEDKSLDLVNSRQWYLVVAPIRSFSGMWGSC